MWSFFGKELRTCAEFLTCTGPSLADRNVVNEDEARPEEERDHSTQQSRTNDESLARDNSLINRDQQQIFVSDYDETRLVEENILTSTLIKDPKPAVKKENGTSSQSILRTNEELVTLGEFLTCRSPEQHHAFAVEEARRVEERKEERSPLTKDMGVQTFESIDDEPTPFEEKVSDPYSAQIEEIQTFAPIEGPAPFVVEEKEKDVASSQRILRGNEELITLGEFLTCTMPDQYQTSVIEKTRHTEELEERSSSLTKVVKQPKREEPSARSEFLFRDPPQATRAKEKVGSTHIGQREKHEQYQNLIAVDEKALAEKKEKSMRNFEAGKEELYTLGEFLTCRSPEHYHQTFTDEDTKPTDKAEQDLPKQSIVLPERDDFYLSDEILGPHFRNLAPFEEEEMEVKENDRALSKQKQNFEAGKEELYTLGEFLMCRSPDQYQAFTDEDMKCTEQEEQGPSCVQRGREDIYLSDEFSTPKQYQNLAPLEKDVPADEKETVLPTRNFEAGTEELLTLGEFFTCRSPTQDQIIADEEMKPMNLEERGPSMRGFERGAALVDELTESRVSNDHVARSAARSVSTSLVTVNSREANGSWAGISDPENERFNILRKNRKGRKHRRSLQDSDTVQSHVRGFPCGEPLSSGSSQTSNEAGGRPTTIGRKVTVVKVKMQSSQKKPDP